MLYLDTGSIAVNEKEEPARKTTPPKTGCEPGGAQQCGALEAVVVPVRRRRRCRGNVQ